MRTVPLGNQCGQRQRGQGSGPVEGLQSEHLSGQLVALEWAGAVCRRNSRDHGDDQRARRGAGQLKTECRPDQKRGDEEEHAEATPCHHQRDRGRACQHHPCLDASIWARARVPPDPTQDEQEGRDDEDTHGIACPPHRPRRPELARWYGGGERERAAAHGSADQRRGQGAEEYQRQRIPQPVQLHTEVGMAKEQTGADDSQRVSCGNAEGGQCGRTERYVDEEGSQRHARPHTQAPDQQADQGDTGRGP
jgi:hypothetical protein